MEIFAIKILDISQEKLENICLLIDKEKRNRIRQFRHKEDKIRTMIAEILLRTKIIEKFDISNNYIMFKKNIYGKPYLEGKPNFNFNISDSGDFVICVIDDKTIGVDIEKVRHIEYKEIAKSFFSVSEFDYIEKKQLNIQLDKFYEIWTLKESYIKCCGQGLSIPLDSFSIETDRYENIKAIANHEYKEHIFMRFDIEPDYKMAVCSLNKEISKNIMIIDQNSLIRDFFT